MDHKFVPNIFSKLQMSPGSSVIFDFKDDAISFSQLYAVHLWYEILV